MENKNPDQSFVKYSILEGASKSVASKKFMANVFLWMFAALGISALFAGVFSASTQLISTLINDDDRGLNLFGYAVMFAPLAFVLLMSFGFARLSAPAMIGLFILYAAING